MVAAWDFHLSCRPGRGEQVQGPNGGERQHDIGGFTINERCVLQALCALVDAVTDSQIAPVLPQLCDFVQSLDGPGLDEYRTAIFSRVKDIKSLQKRRLLPRASPA